MKTLKSFIEQKYAELMKSNSKVELVGYPSIKLNGRSYSESFLSGDTPLDQEGFEVNPLTLELNPDGVHKENATEVKFQIFPKGRKKSYRQSYYFMWE